MTQALSLAEAERLGPALESHLLAAAEAVAHLPAAVLTPAGLGRVRHGNAVGPGFLVSGGPGALSSPGPVRLLSDDGALVAIASSRDGALHPVTVLG